MIYDAADLPGEGIIAADLCVVGSGAGGSAAAMVAAEAGLDVVVLEAGSFLTPADMTQREEEMFPELFWESGARTSRDRGVKIHQGRGVGGSTLHNINLCKRIPRPILQRWAAHRSLDRLTVEDWDALYARVEALLDVSAVPRELYNRHNLLLETGCEKLGWRGGGLFHNRTNCLGSGFCEIGCAYDSKNNAFKVLVPRLIRAGGQVLAHCQAIRVTERAGRVSGVEAIAVDPEYGESLRRITVRAPRVCLSASATATAALLRRSGAPDPTDMVGGNLAIHPAIVVAAEMAEPVYAWRGIPQTYECTELLDFEGDRGRLWILPAFAHPMATATMMPGFGVTHRQAMELYPNLAVLTAMLHDDTAGVVRSRGDRGLTIDYWPHAADRAELARGVVACARLLFAAGARRVVVPTASPISLLPGDSLDPLERLEIVRGLMDITAVHPMASIPMSDDPAQSVIGSDGAHHHWEGLWVADGSLFPTSIGVPPQLSIYALGLHVGGIIARS